MTAFHNSLPINTFLKQLILLMLFCLFSMVNRVYGQNGSSIYEAKFAGRYDNCTAPGYGDRIQFMMNNYNGAGYLWPGWGPQNKEIWYRFTISEGYQQMDITMTANFPHTMRLLEESGIQYALTDNGAGGVSHLIEFLGAGTYYVVGSGSAHQSWSDFSFNISGQPMDGFQLAPEGVDMNNAVYADVFGGIYTDLRSNAPSCMGNDIGEPSNDIYYKFTVDNPSIVTMSHCGSNFDTNMLLLNESGNIINSNSEDRSDECPCASYGYEAYMKMRLEPGTYYLVSEGQSNEMGQILTTIQMEDSPFNCSVETVASTFSNQNRIVTYTPRAKITDIAKLNTASMCQVQQNIQYFDGLGRLIQSIDTKASPKGRDIIQFKEYDPFDREAKHYLPYTKYSLSAGVMRTDPRQEQSQFYKWKEKDIAHNQAPFALTVFEKSPLNRVAMQGSVGNDWQPTASTHPQRFEYAHNNSSIFNPANTAGSKKAAFYTASMDANGVVSLSRTDGNASYPDNQLYVTISKNENWNPSSDGCLNTTEQYTDKSGKTILSRTYNQTPGGLTEMLSTYYVYDDFGNLSFILPPKAEPDTDNAITQSVLDNLCYQYRYDGDNRLIAKKVPGKGWQYMVYNKLDQVVMSQDAEQRNKTPQEWTFAKYDASGRIVVTGIYQHSGSTADSNINIPNNSVRLSLQGTADTSSVLWERRDDNTATGYSSVSMPKNGISSYLIVNYYDNYNIPGLPASYNKQASYSNKTDGLPTASKTAVLNSSDMIWSVSYYNDEGRPVKSFNQHYLGSILNAGNYDEISLNYNFSGQITTSTRKHFVAGNQKLKVQNSYTYDHAGRKLETLEKINDALNWITLSSLEYNELGQPIKKHQHAVNAADSILESLTLDTDDSVGSGDDVTVVASNSITLLPGFIAHAGSSFSAVIQPQTAVLADNFLHSISYTYNERGWLKTAISSLFSQELFYNDALTGTSAQYNGNIANQKWGSSLENVFNYKYDKLNRLTKAETSNMSEALTYDKGGNISMLNRDGSQISYNYNYNNFHGNQLASVSGGGLQNQAYQYDLNGNAITDGSKNNLHIEYNLLNLPKTVSGSQNINYKYDASGKMWSKQGVSGLTEYIYGIQYGNSNNTYNIEFIKTEGGRAVRQADNSYIYEYDLTDHLGNVRVTFQKNPTTGTAEIIQQDNYYAFGKRKSVGLPGSGAVSQLNKYLYNGKDIQDELGQYDYGARFYDPETARWNVVDPLAENFSAHSPYNYVYNSPVNFTDPDGRSPYNSFNGYGGYNNYGGMAQQWPKPLVGVVRGIYNMLGYDTGEPFQSSKNPKRWGFNYSKFHDQDGDGSLDNGDYGEIGRSFGPKRFAIFANVKVDVGIRAKREYEITKVTKIKFDFNALSGNLFEFNGDLLDKSTWQARWWGKDGVYTTSSLEATFSHKDWELGGFVEQHATFHRISDDDGTGYGNSWGLTGFGNKKVGADKMPDLALKGGIQKDFTGVGVSYAPKGVIVIPKVALEFGVRRK